MGPGFDSLLGHKELRIYLALVCLVNITGKVSGRATFGPLQYLKIHTPFVVHFSKIFHRGCMDFKCNGPMPDVKQ